MIKKIDKLVLDAFLGPFLITFLVVVFILLNIQMIKYFDDIIGKGLDWLVLGQLFFYFGVITTPTALPLAVLLSALIAYGNLGEHFELTAIKGSGISLVRTIRPIFFFVLLLTGLAFYANNNMVPKAALEAYSLLYDIKQKKPALDLREGAFYNEIPGISIKVNKKYPDGETIRDIVIYDHRESDGNNEVTKADSGRMFTILNEHYLKLELFDGYNYTEGMANESGMIGKRKSRKTETLSRSKFDRTEVVFDLSSFKLERTDKKWFQGNRIMRNLSELDVDLDSIRREMLSQELAYFQSKPGLFTYYSQNDTLILPPDVAAYKDWRDSTARAKYDLERKKEEEEEKKMAEEAKAREKADTAAVVTPLNKPDTNTPAVKKTPLQSTTRKITSQKPRKPARQVQKPVEQPAKVKILTAKDTLDPAAYRQLVSRQIDSIYRMPQTRDIVQGTANNVRQIKSRMTGNTSGVDRFKKEMITFRIQWHKIIASSFACIAMFLIGAPLGAIIKKGGLGVPFLVSVVFFIVYYVLTIQGEKLAKQESLGVVAGVWLPDFILLLIGLLFLRQARADARIFDMDSYLVFFDRMKAWFRKRRAARLQQA